MSARIDAVDLSHWNGGAIDFAEAKAGGVKAAWHKATEGANYIDTRYALRRGQAEGHVRFGAYHFARPGDPVVQAKRFLSVAKIRPGDLRPMLDLEDGEIAGWSVSRRTRWVRGWVQTVRAATGVPPVIYTKFNLSDTFDCPLWTARYSDAMSAPAVALPWRSWSIWQFTNGVYGSPNSAPGIGHCDINTFNSGVTLDMLTLPVKQLIPATAQAARRIRRIHALRPAVRALLTKLADRLAGKANQN